MADSPRWSSHTFHIPVMGTGFTIDSPLRVAKYGISTAISLVDDTLIEQMRRIHCAREGEPYEEISSSDMHARSRRITAYLNLLDRVVQRQVRALQASPFEKGSEITRYFEMLPESPLRQAYQEMLLTDDPDQKARMMEDLRSRAVPGSIDVNIMTKLNGDVYRRGEKLPSEFAHAMAALRGYAESTLRSSIIFSAGMNARLYGYMSQFGDFFPDPGGVFKKRIALKVSDFRSAVVQGKFLAKRGLWVSEYRIESGLNCGGHAFATKGHLMGPILEEFKRKKDRLVENLHAIYAKALAAIGRCWNEAAREVRITVQGGIGTARENESLLGHYGVDGTGWATPFLLVPEVTNVDDVHLEKLAAAGDPDVHLSDTSPMGIPFWILRNSASEKARRRRIREGRPGIRCTRGFCTFDTEFTKLPICLASRDYQARKLKRITEDGLSAEQLSVVQEGVLSKGCLCRDLAGGAELKNAIDPDATPTLCCGPSIVNFSRVSTLEEMVNHIYGRTSLLSGPGRPHMFIKELEIYVGHLREKVEKFLLGLSTNTPKYFLEFKENLIAGIDYYRRSVEQLVSREEHGGFLDRLEALREALDGIPLPAPAQTADR